MDWSAKIGTFLSDDRLLANLIAIHGGLTLLVVFSFIVRRLVQRGGQQMVGGLGVPWLRGVTEEATGAAGNLVYWMTLALMAACVAGGVFYHLAGRDIRNDAIALWHRHLTAEDAFDLTLFLGKLLGIAIATWVACGFVRHLRGRLEASARRWTTAEVAQEQLLQDTTTEGVWVDENAEAPPATEPQPPPSKPVDDPIRRWFNVLERFSIVLIVLGGTWLAARVAHVPAIEAAVHFLIPLVSIVLVARLLSLSSNSLARVLAGFGDRHLAGPSAQRYWERAKRMFPFGQKCFEAVVYVWAGSAIIRDLGLHLPKVELYSDRAIACVGIFFATRVLIELLHVLVNEAFGMFDASRPVDQKGQTLVPLLQSVIQYTMYFGSVVVMLEVMDGPTNTILAGAGLMGLAVGLGAQSLVSDVVSGFFILFEGQYLVGDVVQICDALGKVEVVSIRHTQVRDDYGKLFIIPNGQIKSVTNYSKGWVNAVVDVKAPTSASLDALLRDMQEAGRRLKAAKREVLADTVIKGLVDLSPGEMTVRAVTKVMPGTHAAMQAEYRKHLKDVMDQRPQKAAA